MNNLCLEGVPFHRPTLRILWSGPWMATEKHVAMMNSQMFPPVLCSKTRFQVPGFDLFIKCFFMLNISTHQL